LKKYKILIVGGTGFIGFNLAKKCIYKKWLVTCISKNRPKKNQKIKKVKYLQLNILNKKKLSQKLSARYDFIINLAGNKNISKKSSVNLDYVGLKNIIEIFDKNRPNLFLQIGSSAEYGKINSPVKEEDLCRPISKYGKSKLKASNYLQNKIKKNNFPAAILRLFQPYGPNQKKEMLVPFVINSCLKDEKFDCTIGTQKRDFLYIDDLINLFFLCFANKKIIGKTLNVGSGEQSSVKKIINMIKEEIKLGKPIFGKKKIDKNEILDIYPKIDKLKNLLKWKPKTSLKAGLVKTIRSHINEF